MYHFRVFRLYSGWNTGSTAHLSGYRSPQGSSERAVWSRVRSSRTSFLPSRPIHVRAPKAPESADRRAEGLTLPPSLVMASANSIKPTPRRAVRSDRAAVRNDLASVRRDRSMMRRHLFAVMGDRSMTLRDLFAVKCDLIMLLNQLTTARASCRGERREITIERWHVRRRPSDVSDRRADIAANRCPVTAPPDDVQRSIGHVVERDHVLTTRGNDLASAHDDLTSRINDLTSRIHARTSTFNDLTSTFNDLTSTFNDLPSILDDLLLASETLNHGSHVGAVGHVARGRLLGRPPSYISRHGARNAALLLQKEIRAAE